ncbi:ComEC/Rec2 family competence protein [Sinimarinibacterium flocculans]|uniref:ComEC/Rec2 family competence protein n=1 Tax=Sinimarinibacterium flocculans TaxID=985250 RepID=UPI003518F80F
MADSLVVLDVGHGSCSVLHEGQSVAVIDAGPGAALLEYLQSTGIKDIDLVVVSHSDADHLGGLVALLASDEFNVSTILINTDSQKASRAWNDLRVLIADKQSQGRLTLKLGVYSGPITEWTPGKTRLEAVSPSVSMALGGAGSNTVDGAKVTQNTNSIAVRVLYEEKPIVFLGADIDAVTLDDIKKSRKACEAPFLVFPHHGGKPGEADPADFARQLLALVKPNHVIFSNGRGLHDTPRPEIVQAVIAAKGISIGCTQLSKHCCAGDLPKPTPHVSALYSHGAARGHSCTGTIEIDLKRAEIASPSLKAHGEFVIKFETAMCRESLTSSVT